MRLVHLVEAAGRPEGGGEEAALACRAVLDAGGGAIEQRVWLIGTAEDSARARRVGLPVDRRIWPARGIPELAWSWVRAELQAGGEPDAVVSWSPGALALARLATMRARGVMRVGVMIRPPRQAWSLRARTRLDVGLRGAVIVALDEASARAWRLAGAEDVRTGVYVPRGATEAEAGERRAALRAEFGLGHDDAAVVLLSDPPHAADARRFVFTLGLTYTMGCRVAGIIPAARLSGGGALTKVQRRRAARFVRAHGRRWGLIEWPGPLVDVLPACDAAVCDLRAGPASEDEARLSAGAVLVANACAAGVPPVLPATDAADEIATMGWNIVRAAGRGTKVMAAAILPLLEDQAVRREAARRTAVLPDVPRARALGPVVLDVCREAVENGRGTAPEGWPATGSDAAEEGAVAAGVASGSTE